MFRCMNPKKRKRNKQSITRVVSTPLDFALQYRKHAPGVKNVVVIPKRVYDPELVVLKFVLSALV